MTMIKKSPIFLMFACLLLVNGCANQETTRTGFLGSYNQMQADAEGNLRYVNPQFRDRYIGFMVDEVTYAPGSNSDSLDAEQIALLKKEYRESLISNFSKKYTPAQAAGANVMRVRPAITGVSTAVAPLNYVTTLAILTPVSNGGISTENEVVDSVTGERLVALSLSSNPDVTDGEVTGYFTETGHAKSMLDDHARRVYDLVGSSK
ncbi:MAG: DUF3313 domain-containing protein [Alphaproteobacteria bacterium]